MDKILNKYVNGQGCYKLDDIHTFSLGDDFNLADEYDSFENGTPVRVYIWKNGAFIIQSSTWDSIEKMNRTKKVNSPTINFSLNYKEAVKALSDLGYKYLSSMGQTYSIYISDEWREKIFSYSREIWMKDEV